MTYILVVGLLATLSHASDERPPLNADEAISIKDSLAWISRRLETLEPKFSELEDAAKLLVSGGLDPESEEYKSHDTVRNLDTVAAELMPLLDDLDEMEKRLQHVQSKDAARSSTQPTRSTGRKPRIPEHGRLRALVGSQDPGAARDNLRRTGVIVDVNIRMGKNGGHREQVPGKYGRNKGRDGTVGERTAKIQLDHQMPHEHKDIYTFISCYEEQHRDPEKTMRRGDRVSFEVMPGRSSDPRKIRDGRVMAGKVRKIGFLSQDERESPEWIEIFGGTVVNPDDGKSVRLFHADTGASSGAESDPSGEEGEKKKKREALPFWQSEFGMASTTNGRNAGKDLQRAIRRRDMGFPGTCSTAAASSYKHSKHGTASSRQSSRSSNRSAQSGDESGNDDEQTCYRREVDKAWTESRRLEAMAQQEAEVARARAEVEDDGLRMYNARHAQPFQPRRHADEASSYSRRSGNSHRTV